MKKTVLIFLVAIVFITSVSAQILVVKKPVSDEKGISISGGIHIPIGDFSSTHLLGIAVDISPSRHLFGVLKRKKTAFTYNGGLAYYFGKKETVSNYPYKYPAYIFIHGFGGLLYNPFKKAGISLTGGPALGVYNGDLQFNIGSKLEISYYITSNIAIGPGIVLMKEFGANLIWAASFKARFDL